MAKKSYYTPGAIYPHYATAAKVIFSSREKLSGIFNKKRMDQQRWMDILACHGPSLLNTVIGNFSNYDSDDDTDEQMLFEFLRWKHNEIGNPSRVPKPNCLLKPDPLVAMPPEMYRRSLNKMKKRQLFFKHLQRRDILYLQVLNSDDKESYKCLVLAKHGDLMQLDDLSIVVHFPKLRPELKLIRGDLYKFDLIRGAFWSCSVWERKLFVTMDTSIFSEKEKESIPKLGKITRKDLPYYVRLECHFVVWSSMLVVLVLSTGTVVLAVDDAAVSPNDIHRGSIGDRSGSQQGKRCQHPESSCIQQLHEGQAILLCLP
ncbi:hypothetical protein AVEN_243568-1 [Araneus ventricosus]|uniref:Uncharacterized protein n=1 Tax=Araneus ventricosus TaxID=182803 RepID=A0A4Y2A4A5_ARAVE|nr:hypothetical protein AVEN_243568-1 [Araneus ventricosus]